MVSGSEECSCFDVTLCHLVPVCGAKPQVLIQKKKVLNETLQYLTSHPCSQVSLHFKETSGCFVTPVLCSSSVTHSAAAAAAKSLQSCPTLCDPIDGSPPGSPIPGILQARTLGCHFLLQCMKVKSESEVAQSCPTLRNPMDCSLPGSAIHGIF